tara:strand:+ start:1383 stop:1712 length:330 start_codon:yes stop_codon:yes gene_type:complete
MAKLQKFRAHESLNMDSAADWQIQTVNSITGAESYDVSNYHTVHLMSTQDIYFEFTNSSTDALATANTLYLMGGDTIYSLKVPRALGDSIYLWIEDKSGSGASVRVVLS